MPLSFDAINADRIAHNYGEVARRAVHNRTVFKEAVGVIQEAEQRHFTRLRGRYVLTGATKKSLTSRGTGSIRKVHDGELEFGTRVRQAHFLTKAPHDPNSGQVRRRDGYLSAVLVFSRATKKAVARMVLDYVAEPF